MKHVLWISLVGCLLLTGVSLAEPKAFDVVNYAGEAVGLKVAMAYADGLLDATEVTLSGKALPDPVILRFQGGEDDDVTFLSDDGAYRMTCKLAEGDEPPPSVSGTLHVSGATHRVVLRK